MLGEAAKRAAAILEQGRRLADQIASSQDRMAPMPNSDQLTPDHPLSRAFGFERARRLINPELEPRRVKAAERRELVRRMSLDRRPVEEIADAAQLSYDYIVKIRSGLREEGRLPPLC